MWFEKIRNFLREGEYDAIIVVCLLVLSLVLVIPSSLLATFGIISLESCLTIIKIMFGLWMATPILSIISN